MQLIKKTRLVLETSEATRVYEVEITERSTDREERFLVNFRHGVKGKSLREGTKTSSPVSRDEAEKIFASIEVAKRNDGYHAEGESPASNAESSELAAETATPTTLEDRNREIIAHLHHQLQQLRNNSAEHAKRRSRIVWRLTELQDSACLPLIKPHIGRGFWLEDYTIAWALGILGSQSEQNELHRLRSSEHKAVSAIAFEAQLKLTDPSGRATLLQPILNSLPNDLQALADAGDTKALSQYLDSWLLQDSGDQNARLKDLYLLCIDRPVLHQALLTCCELVPFEPGYFKGIRYLLKASEFRRDGAMFGVLTRRIETTRPYFNNTWDYAYIPGERRPLKPSRELKRKDSRLAYSHKTRQYLRRRSWRVLRRLGTAGSPDYTGFAVGILNAMDDELDTGARPPASHQWNTSTPHYGDYAGFLAFNHILRENNPRYVLSKSGRAWEFYPDTPAPAKRHEAFPTLWDQQPELLLNLLLENRCAPVHEFACNALTANRKFHSSIDAEALGTLLNSRYQCTAEFALGIVRERLAEGGVGSDLIVALASSAFSEARKLATEILSHQSENLMADLPLIARLLLVDQEDIRAWLKGFMESFHPDEKQQSELLDIVLSHGSEQQLTMETAALILTITRQKLPQAAESLPLNSLPRLLSSQWQGNQWLGGQLLLTNRTSYADIPASLHSLIAESPFEEVRAIGISLLSKQPDHELLKQPQALLDIFTHGNNAERAAVTPVIARLGQRDDGFLDLCVSELLPLAFRSEAQEGFHRDLENLFKGPLENTWPRVDKDLLWRMLQAKSRAAQNISAAILNSRTGKRAEVLSVRQWATLANHDLAEVRAWSHQAYNDNLERIREQAIDAFRIFNATWPDSREFAMEFFREYFPEERWTPELIVALCDNPHDDVQAFGREILLRNFHNEKGTEYLLMLSQHPSLNVQLFVTGFLEEQASGDPATIERLEPFFVSVLSNVNKGRVSKDRVLEFLIEEARHSEPVARLTANILSRQSLTIVSKDRARMVSAMLLLGRLYPDLELPLTQKPLRSTHAQGVH